MKTENQIELSIVAIDSENKTVTLTDNTVTVTINTKHAQNAQIGDLVTATGYIKGLFTKAHKAAAAAAAEAAAAAAAEAEAAAAAEAAEAAAAAEAAKAASQSKIEISTAFYNDLLKALKARNNETYSKDTDISIAYLEDNAKQIIIGASKFSEDILSTLVSGQFVTAKATDQFIAVKVNVKILRLLNAFGQGIISPIDGYSVSMIKNLIQLTGLNTYNLQRSVCTKLKSTDQLTVEKQVTVYHNCTPSTAHTQVSSTREMLRHLGICKVSKRKKNDEISFIENDQSKLLNEIFKSA